VSWFPAYLTPPGQLWFGFGGHHAGSYVHLGAVRSEKFLHFHGLSVESPGLTAEQKDFRYRFTAVEDEMSRW
jgi:hypothetical protein